jgi:hypothetical protein
MMFDRIDPHVFRHAPGAPAAVLPHLPFVLPAPFAGSTLGLFLFGKVSDAGFRRAISVLLLFSGAALVA